MTAKYVQVEAAGAPLKAISREVPEPKAGEVRVRVEACGVCHSDSLTVAGLWPLVTYPRVPGHEIIGRVDSVGANVPQWKSGQRVGIGWYGGHCRRCEPCRRGDLVACQNPLIPGIVYDGGYAEFVVAPAEALAAVPDSLKSVEAAPLLCAGITTFNALRNTGAKPPDTVAILGMGGLGHLGVQFAAKMGFRTIAIARGADKEKFAHDLGARHYIDSTREDVSASLRKLGGARVILATVTDAGAMSAAIGGLGYRGEFVILGVPAQPVQVPVPGLVMQRQSIHGWPSGTSIDSEDTLKFSEASGVLPMIETYPLANAADAYARMMSGKARFRVVLEMGA
ncbi:MAG TPA: alcohol dehydrogenase [Bryobacteraceae bacterium]|nr:alcohol dehydrogenase [Bryobacteraceae bacterium]